MVKAPRPGRVKTRLAKDIGTIEAAWWFRHQVRATLRAIGRDPRWETILLVSPDSAAHGRDWPAAVPRIPQGRGDLGARMARGLRAAPPGPVLLIGGDIPGIRPRTIADAFRALSRAGIVHGPAADGGFWLVGLKRGGAPAPRALFGGCRWSSPHALADSEASAAPLRLARAATLRDVDRAADLPPRR